MKTNVVGLGEVLFDMLPSGRMLGGAPANFAGHVAQLGLNGFVVSAVGDDELGHEIKTTFEKRHIGSELETVAYPTGTVQVKLDAQGIPEYIIKENVAWDNIVYTATLKKLAAKTDCVCFGSLAQRNIVSRSTVESFLNDMPADSYKVFDINLRQQFYSKEIIEKSMHLCNVLKINDEELDIVCAMLHFNGDIKNRCEKLLSSYNIEMLILTCGADCSYVFTLDAVSYLKTPVVEVADTVGAGDAFTAAFCASILKGYDVKTAHRKAVDVSAYICTQAGALPLLPDNLK